MRKTYNKRVVKDKDLKKGVVLLDEKEAKASPWNRLGGLAQLARAPALHAGGQRFDSVILHNISSLTYWN